jgi:hypothetical protein
LAGCATTFVRHKVEKRLERHLGTLLGPADEYRVRFVDTPDAELVQGRARQVDVEGRNIRVKNQFLLESLHLHLVDVRYGRSEPYLVSIRRSDLEVEFTDTALNQYLQKREAKYEPVLRFEQDRVRVQMLYPFLGKPTPVTAAGHFEIEEGRRLLFRAEEARVPLFLPTNPGGATSFVDKQLNPLLDLARLDFPARLESIQIVPGRLKAVGTAALPR